MCSACPVFRSPSPPSRSLSGIAQRIAQRGPSHCIAIGVAPPMTSCQLGLMVWPRVFFISAGVALCHFPNLAKALPCVLFPIAKRCPRSISRSARSIVSDLIVFPPGLVGSLSRNSPRRNRRLRRIPQFIREGPPSFQPSSLVVLPCFGLRVLTLVGSSSSVRVRFR